MLQIEVAPTECTYHPCAEALVTIDWWLTCSNDDIYIFIQLKLYTYHIMHITIDCF